MLSLAAVVLMASAQAAAAQSADEPTTTRMSVGKGPVDYANARPMPLPSNAASPASQADLIAAGAEIDVDAPSGFRSGRKGSGRKQPVKLPKSTYKDDGGVTPQAFGTSNHPFTTAVQADSSGDPYRRAGKVFFTDGADTFVCSASMIRPGLAVTAAHCVAAFGEKRFYRDIRYIPAYRDGTAPYGVWTTQSVFVMTSYYNGKAKCATKGVVCENDIAILVLAPQGSTYAGDRTGYFGFAWGGYSYNKNNQVLITQLGYPSSLNRGEQMMRTDSQGSVDKRESGNTIIGSLQTGGSSGGPWLANFGFGPSSFSEKVKPGKEADRMIVVGTTSWGYNKQSIKQQGASPFTSKNIKTLVEDACGAYPAAC